MVKQQSDLHRNRNISIPFRELAAFYVSEGMTGLFVSGRISIPFRELAAFYATEGNAMQIARTLFQFPSGN